MSAYKNLIRRAELFCRLADEYANGPAHYLVTVPAWREADRLRAEAETLAARATVRGRAHYTNAHGYIRIGEIAGRTVCRTIDGRWIKGLVELTQDLTREVWTDSCALENGVRERLLDFCLRSHGACLAKQVIPALTTKGHAMRREPWHPYLNNAA